MSKKTSVAIHPDALSNVVVETALLWAGQLREGHEDIETMRARHKEIGYVLVRADRFEAGGHFGPTMTFDGPRSPLELTIPWHQILAFVFDKSGKMKIGFEGAKSTRPKRRHPASD